MTTDRERQEATSLWTVSHLEQRVRELTAQLATVTARAEAAEAQSDIAYGEATRANARENDAIKRAETAEAKLLALQVDRSKAVKLRDETDSIIWSLMPDVIPGAINWGDLGVREVQEVIDEERCWWRVVIEEADPNNPALHNAVLAGLVVLGWNADDIEIETTW